MISATHEEVLAQFKAISQTIDSKTNLNIKLNKNPIIIEKIEKTRHVSKELAQK